MSIYHRDSLYCCILTIKSREFFPFLSKRVLFPARVLKSWRDNFGCSKTHIVTDDDWKRRDKETILANTFLKRMNGLRAYSIGAMALNMFTWPWRVEGPLCYLLDELLKPRFSPWQWFITWKFLPLMQSGCPVLNQLWLLGLISYDVPRVGVHYSDTCVTLGPKIRLLCRLVKTVRVVSSVASRNLS